MRLFDARFSEDVFGFLRVECKRVIVQHARQADRQEALMDEILPFSKSFVMPL